MGVREGVSADVVAPELTQDRPARLPGPRVDQDVLEQIRVDGVRQRQGVQVPDAISELLHRARAYPRAHPARGFENRLTLEPAASRTNDPRMGRRCSGRPPGSRCCDTSPSPRRVSGSCRAATAMAECDRLRFERAEHACADSKAAMGAVDPHSHDLADLRAERFQRPATRRLSIEAGEHECPRGWDQALAFGGQRPPRIEALLEALAQLREVMGQAPPCVGRGGVLERDAHHRDGQQMPDLRLGAQQPRTLFVGQRRQCRRRELIGYAVELAHLGPPARVRHNRLVRRSVGFGLSLDKAVSLQRADHA